MYKGMSPMGEPVYYIITDASDFEYAKQMGLNYAPKLRHAAGSAGAQEVTVEDGVITFKGNVDFSPDTRSSRFAEAVSRPRSPSPARWAILNGRPP
jgi:hypothetical protein